MRSVSNSCPGEALTHGRSGDHRDDDLCEISGNERDDACGECLAECHTGKIRQPGGAEQVQHKCAEYHTNKMNRAVLEMIDKISADQRQKDVSDEVASGRPEKFSGAAAESGEDWKADQSEQEIEQAADGSPFHPEHVDREEDCQIGERDRNRADGNADRQRPQDADDGGHQSDDYHRFCLAGGNCRRTL